MNIHAIYISSIFDTCVRDANFRLFCIFHEIAFNLLLNRIISQPFIQILLSLTQVLIPIT